jgi:hypothetical protein
VAPIKRPPQQDLDTSDTTAEDNLVRALELFAGWDPERRRWVHGDPGKQALALVNEAAANRRAREGADLHEVLDEPAAPAPR